MKNFVNLNFKNQHFYNSQFLMLIFRIYIIFFAYKWLNFVFFSKYNNMSIRILYINYILIFFSIFLTLSIGNSIEIDIVFMYYILYTVLLDFRFLYINILGIYSTYYLSIPYIPIISAHLSMNFVDLVILIWKCIAFLDYNNS